MSDTVSTSILSAAIAAAIGGAISFVVARQQTAVMRAQYRLMAKQLAWDQQRREIEDRRGVIDPVLNLAAKIVAPMTIDCSAAEADSLLMEWDMTAKRVYIEVEDGDIYQSLHVPVRNYLQTLLRFKAGGKSRKAVEQERQKAADDLRSLASSLRRVPSGQPAN